LVIARFSFPVDCLWINMGQSVDVRYLVHITALMPHALAASGRTI
jgi:hypothetical protein